MLKISNVETFYGKIQALRGVDLDVNDGEIVFHDEYKHKKCPNCECKWARVLYTPKFRHHAKLECRDCGCYHRWLKKSECEFK